MKNILLPLFLASCSTLLFGQKYSPKVETLSKQYLAELPKMQQLPYNQILEQRKKLNLNTRLDTMAFDYAFIEETYTIGDSVPTIHERYFIEADRKILDYSLQGDPELSLGTIPRTLFINGQRWNVQSEYYSTSVAYTAYYDLIDYYYTLDTILANFGSMQAVQAMIYDQTQHHEEITNNFSEKKQELEQLYVERLKKTYQIVTLIDNKTKSVKVSVQVPQKNPFVELRYVERYHYSW